MVIALATEVEAESVRELIFEINDSQGTSIFLESTRFLRLDTLINVVMACAGNVKVRAEKIVKSRELLI